MSLPAAQQRALEAIADTLRASEPRLAATFTTFTLLTRNEAWPQREQLPDRHGFRHLLALLRMRLWARPVRFVGRRRWRQVLIISPVVLALAAAGLLIGYGARGGPACKRTTAATTTITRLSAASCGAPPARIGAERFAH
jgi:hypothetical protein